MISQIRSPRPPCLNRIAPGFPALSPGENLLPGTYNWAATGLRAPCLNRQEFTKLHQDEQTLG